MHRGPKTVRERGARALQNLRMDFLMLLAGNRRVVLEVDGIQHSQWWHRARQREVRGDHGLASTEPPTGVADESRPAAPGPGDQMGRCGGMPWSREPPTVASAASVGKIFYQSQIAFNAMTSRHVV